MPKQKKPVGRPPAPPPAPIPDTERSIIETVVRTRSKPERDRILKHS